MKHLRIQTHWRWEDVMKSRQEYIFTMRINSVKKKEKRKETEKNKTNDC